MLTGKALFNTLLAELNEMGLPGMSATLDEMYRSPDFLELDPLMAIATLVEPEYHDIGEVDGLASTFEYSFGESGDPAEGKDYPPVYTGLGDEFNLAFNHGTILTNSLEDQPYKYTTNANDSNNVNIGEIIPIKILGENLTASVDKSESSGLNNLANWCVHNFHNITFKNPTSRSVTIYGYISGAANGATTVINYDGETYYTEMSSDMGLLTWRWCKITLAPNETFNFSYQHILATHSHGCQVTEWRLE